LQTGNLTLEMPTRYNIVGGSAGGVLHGRPNDRAVEAPEAAIPEIMIMRRWCESRTFRRMNRLHLMAVGALLCLQAGFEGASPADDAPAVAKDPQDQQPPVGQFLTISGTVDDSVFGRVNRTALALQTRAQQEKRRGVLVLEILPGSSRFDQVLGLARFLATELPSLTTVAFIPEKLTGNHVVLALACKEIIMRPEAELGDISQGTPIDPNDQAFVVNLVTNHRHNNKLNEALVWGMLDRQKEILWVQVELGKKPNSTLDSRVVSRSGYDDLAKAGAQIHDVKTIKEAGSPGVFSGERARGYNILVMYTAQSREEVATLYRLPREAMRQDATTGEPPRAMIIRIDSVIEPILEQFVLRQIERAVSTGVNLLIFEIESPGGRALTSMNMAGEIADLSNKKVRTVAYVPKQALSGAAIIAMGCDEIYLQGDAQIGDAGAIQELGKGGQFEFVPQKFLGPLRSTMETLAEKKHRPPALLVAMMDKDLTVYQVTNRETGRVSYMSDDEIRQSNEQWIKGDAVPEAGRDKLLTVRGRRAHELHLAEVPVKDFAELQTRLGIPNEVKVAVSARTWVDTLIFFLNTGVATALLFMLGLASIYLELHFPSGLFGICACVCFGLFFWSRFLGGTAGWLEVVLFLLGAGFLAIEVFVVPGFGVFGVSGVILCAFSLILASQTSLIPATAEDVRELAKSLGAMTSAIVGVVVMAALFSRYLPSIPLFHAMILTPPGTEAANSGEPRLRPDLAGEASFVNTVLERDQSLVGRQGVAMTVLRPAGKAQIGEEFVDVVSDGPFISSGRKIEVLAVAGNRVVVREIA
jgi:membrane-bound serine protease (ClpP class)